MTHYLSIAPGYLSLLKVAGLLLLLPFCCQAQLPSAVIEIQGRIFEHGTQLTRPLSNVEVWVNNKAYVSDKSGNFFLKVPFSEESIKLNIQPNGYRIMKPFNSEFQLDPSNTIFHLEIFVMQQTADDQLVKTVNALESKLIRLRSDHRLNQRQLNRIHQIMLDTLVFFDRQKQEFVKEIEGLHTELAQSTVANNELERRLNATEDQLFSMEQRVQLLNVQLYDALEEKYLRQQGIYNEVSAALNDYLLRVKDVNDALVRLNEHFPLNYSPSGSQAYNTTLEAYNQAFSLLNEKKDEFLEGVDHYWEARNTSTHLANTFRLLFLHLHQEQLLPALTQINSDLRLRKRKAAIKSGEQTVQNLSPLIDRLELSIQKTISLMKYQI